MFEGPGPGSWAEIAKFVEHSGSNAFVRNLLRTLTDLYDLDEQGITPDNWELLDAEIRRRQDVSVHFYAYGASMAPTRPYLSIAPRGPVPPTLFYAGGRSEVLPQGIPAHLLSAYCAWRVTYPL